MPDSPRPSIAFPAFQTPGGLLPQAVREHHSDYAETQGAARELNRRTDGYWIDLPYSPGRFLGYFGTWAVQKKDCPALRYKIIGAEMRVSVNVTGTVSVPEPVVRIVLPERMMIREQVIALWFGSPPNAPILVAAQRGGRTLDCYRLDSSNWPAGPAQVSGEIVFEVQES